MIRFLVYLDAVVAPEPDKISRKKCTPTVALLVIFSDTCPRRADTAVDFDGHFCIRADSTTKVNKLFRLLIPLSGSLDVQGGLRAMLR